jgi:hypothetical protein
VFLDKDRAMDNVQKYNICIPVFIIKVYSDVFVPDLKPIFNLSRSQQLSMFSKKATTPLLTITDQYPFLIIFPNYLN